jgi:hypothetical protein
LCFAQGVLCLLKKLGSAQSVVLYSFCYAKSVMLCSVCCIKLSRLCPAQFKCSTQCVVLCSVCCVLLSVLCSAQCVMFCAVCSAMLSVLFSAQCVMLCSVCCVLLSVLCSAQCVMFCAVCSELCSVCNALHSVLCNLYSAQCVVLCSGIMLCSPFIVSDALLPLLCTISSLPCPYMKTKENSHHTIQQLGLTLRNAQFCQWFLILMTMQPISSKFSLIFIQCELSLAYTVCSALYLCGFLY